MPMVSAQRSPTWRPAMPPSRASFRDYLSPGTERTYAVAGENTPTNQNWDYIVATAICVALT